MINLGRGLIVLTNRDRYDDFKIRLETKRFTHISSKGCFIFKTKAPAIIVFLVYNLNHKKYKIGNCTVSGVLVLGETSD